jgi:putative ABC transport system permease protein
MIGGEESRAALRRLMARPGHSLLAISVLGVGLGTALFLLGLVNGLVLKPMPFPNADRLVAVGYEKDGNIGIGGMDFDEYELIRREIRSLDTTAIYEPQTLDVIVEGKARHYRGCMLSEQMLPLLGVQPALGRGFIAADQGRNTPLTALISDETWRNDFGGASDIAGRSVRINGEAATIIGVMPKAFGFPSNSQIWLPSRLQAGVSADVEMIARLAPGSGLGQARDDLGNVAANLGSSLNGQRAGRKLTIKPIALSFVSERTRAYVWLMFAAGSLVLLLACANAANLQLGLALNRRRELAIRSALGASRNQLLLEQLMESFLLSVAATIIALGIAEVGAYWIESIFAANDKAPPYFVALGVDARMLFFAALAAVVTTGLAGLMPAWRASRTDVQDALRDGGKGSRGGAFGRASRALVIAEIALTVVLLVGAGTFIHGLQRMLSSDVSNGSDPSRILTARVDLNDEHYPDAAARLKFFENVSNRMRAEAGVTEATIGNTIPGAVLGSHEFVAAEGWARPESGYPRAQLGVVDEHFAGTYGLSVTEGRFFGSEDGPDSVAVTVVDRELADSLWPGRSAIGQRLVLHPEQKQPKTLLVIGVTTALQLDAALEPSLPSLLVPLRQSPVASAILAMRTRDAAENHGVSISALVAGLDPEIPVYASRTQQRAISMGRISALVLTQVFSAVGLIGLLLAAAGLFGVLSFSVAQRTREFGIRRAIGASSGAIVGNVGRIVLFQLATGLSIGIALALPWSSALADPKMQTRGHEGMVFLIVASMVSLIAVIATVAPMMRALRVDPTIALRHE